MSTPADWYMAKDYLAFRELLISTMAQTAPGWSEDQPSDLSVAMLEIMAYAGDALSMAQDAASTEATLSTARLRRSVSRHLRLLDDRLSEGCNARTLVHVRVRSTVVLPPGVVFSGQPMEPGPPALLAVDRAQRRGVQFFQSMHRHVLHHHLNEMDLIIDDALLEGATEAMVPVLRRRPYPRRGDVMILKQTRSRIGGPPDPSLRHPVRLSHDAEVVRVGGAQALRLRWWPQDALPFSLGLRTRGDGQPAASVQGNNVLADQGITTTEFPVLRVEHGRFEPLLTVQGLTWATPLSRAQAEQLPVVTTMVQDPREAVAQIELTQDLGAGQIVSWHSRTDLLGSGPFARDVVVEPAGPEHHLRLRFGDGRYGRAPVPGATLRWTARVGNGMRGNVGPDSLRYWSAPVQAPEAQQTLATAIERCTNPLPGRGGLQGERTEIARQRAPHAFRAPASCVLPQDWVDAAVALQSVDRAACEVSRSSGRRVFLLYVCLKHHTEPSRDAVRRVLEPLRLIGDRLEVRGPVRVPIDIVVHILIAQPAAGHDVVRRVRQVLVTDRLPDGGAAWFSVSEDRLDFAQVLYRSALLATISSVSGVVSAHVPVFRRSLTDDHTQVDHAVERIEMSPIEVPLFAKPGGPTRDGARFAIHVEVGHGR